MKHLGKTLVCLLLCLTLLLGLSVSALAVSCTNCSDWFTPSYQEMLQLGLIPDAFDGFDLKKNITRSEMCYLAVHAYQKITKNSIELSDSAAFSDTSDPIILEAYELGIVGGYPDGSYHPDNYLTRQEFFQIILNFCNSAAFHPSTDGTSLSQFCDVSALASWANEAAKACVKCKYVGGTSTKNGLALNPSGYTSRQEAMAMFLRCYKGLSEYYYGLVLNAKVVENADDANVTVVDTDGTLYVSASTLNVRDSWTTNSTIVGQYSFGDSVRLTGACSNGWKRINYKGNTAYVSGTYLTSQTSGGQSGGSAPAPVVTGSGTATEIANKALSYVGYSYVYGAASPEKGFDCSGLMYYVLHTVYGYSMNRVADDQMDQGSAVDRGSLQIGDLVFFGSGSYANHVGMYIGNDNFVHAASPSSGVRINSLNETYYRTRYIGARRIIN